MSPIVVIPRGSLLCAYSHIFPPLPSMIPRANRGSSSFCCLTPRLLSRVTGTGQPFLYHHRFISLPDNAYLGIQALIVTPQTVLGRRQPSTCNDQKQLAPRKVGDGTECIGFGVSLSQRLNCTRTGARPAALLSRESFVWTQIGPPMFPDSFA
jgi:hypothetical protein